MSTLVGWWKGEDNTVDSVNGNDIIASGIEYQTGAILRCFRQPSASSYQQIPYTELLNFNSNSKFTIEFYFDLQTDLYGNRYGFSFRKTQSSDPDDYIWDIRIGEFPNNRRILIQHRLNGNQRYDNCFSYGVFSKVRIVQDNAHWEVYVNDVLLTPDNGYISEPFNAYPYPIYITKYSDYPFAIDEIKIYDDSEPTTTSAPTTTTTSAPTTTTTSAPTTTTTSAPLVKKIYLTQSTARHIVKRLDYSTIAVYDNAYFGEYKVNAIKNTTLNFPHELAVDYGQNVYVCDTNNKRIVKFDQDLNFIDSYNTELTVGLPYSILFSNSDLYIIGINVQYLKIERITTSLVSVKVSDDFQFKDTTYKPTGICEGFDPNTFLFCGHDLAIFETTETSTFSTPVQKLISDLDNVRYFGIIKHSNGNVYLNDSKRILKINSNYYHIGNSAIIKRSSLFGIKECSNGILVYDAKNKKIVRFDENMNVVNDVYISTDDTIANNADNVSGFIEFNITPTTTTLAPTTTTTPVPTTTTSAPSLSGWWKGEDNTVDSIAGNDATWEIYPAVTTTTTTGGPTTTTTTGGPITTPGPEVIFSRPDGHPEIIDIISPAVNMARGNTQGIFNSVTEVSYTHGSSPADTEWSPIYGSAQPDPTALVYTDWETAVWASPPSMVGNFIYMHIISEDTYYEMRFTSWTSLGGGGGFSYYRYDITP